MARPFASVGVAVAAAWVTFGASPARAQRTATAELGMDATRVQLAGYQSAVLGTISGLLATDGDLWRAHAAVSASRFETGHSTLYATGSATFDVLRLKGWRASWTTDGGSGAFRGDFSGHYLRTAGRVLYTVSPVSMWVAGTIGHVRQDGSYRTHGREAGLGIVQRWLAMTATVNRADIDGIAYTDWQTQLSGTWPRLQVGINTGKRLLDDVAGRTRWTNAQATYDIQPSIQLVVTGGTEPSDPQRAVLGAKWVSVGVHLHAQRQTHALTSPDITSYGPSVRVSEVQSDGSRVIVVRIEHAERVELMGDFTDWEPMPMTRTSDHSWKLSVPIAPGSHRLDIRIDGGDWEVPPGMPSLPDDFGGVAGVIAVE